MIKTKILLRIFIVCLLLITETKVAWGWGETFKFWQNYEATGATCDWVSAITDRYTATVVTNNGNHYVSIDAVSDGGNGARVYTTSTNGLVADGEDFVLSFDIILSCGNTDASWFQVNDSRNWALDPNHSEASNYRLNSSILILAADKANSTSWIINGNSDQKVTVNRTEWHSFKIRRIGNTTYLTVINKETSSTLLNNVQITTNSTTGGLGNIEYATKRYYAHMAIDNVLVTSPFTYDAASATVPLTKVGILNHPAISELPTIINETGTTGTITYSSSNTSVARVDNSGNVYLVGTGTTGIIATMGSYTTSYELTVTGSNASTNTTTSISSGTTTKTWSLASEGVMPRGGVADLGAITMSYGINTEMGVAVNDGGTYVMKVVDANGYSHAAINGTTHLPDNASYGGTYYTFRPAANGTLTINGKLNKPRLYNSDGTELVNNDNNETSVTANLTANNVYYFYCEPWECALLSSFSYSYQAYLTKSYDAVPSTQSSYTLPTVEGFTSPSYSIVGTAGEISTSDVSISGTTLSGFSGKPGAVKVSISEGGTVFYFVLTVAYPATPYPGHLWDFNIDDDNKTSLKIHKSDVAAGRGFPRIDARSTPAITLEGDEATDATGYTITDNLGHTWAARNKNVNVNAGRDARWRYTNAVHGDNAFIIEETAGLVFNTGGNGFFIRNDRLQKHAPNTTPEAYKGQSCWSHVGIRQNGASFTIPCLKAGDIIEINWKREAGGAGGTFAATNASDLRDIAIDKLFEMTGSQTGTTNRVTDFHKNPGLTSFKATADGDVTFTLRDAGATDILAIRIYSGEYRPTMRTINTRDNHNVTPDMLVDDSYQEYAYNYCNMLNSTNTGPAFYVLKGWRSATDNVESVTGCDAARDVQQGSPVFHLHTDPYAYRVTDADEEARLYDLRKNLRGFRLWNYNWVSSRNAYNDGRVGASGGWGKVTFRMNNYTNFVDESDGTKTFYLIGYTPDCTLTIGSAPHQTYPYTWDFTKIAGGTATGKGDNVLYSIEEEGSQSAFNGQAPTNWIKNGNGQFMLNTDNSEEAGSQYVPGAVLVTTERALSRYPVAQDETAVCARDELDGLGFAGDITMHIDHLPSDVASGWNRTAVAERRNSLLSFKITDYAVFTPAEGTEVDDHIGTWSFPTTEQEAGNGTVQLDSHVSIDESNIPAEGIGYRLDGGNTKKIHFKLATNTNLQAGDIISVTAYNAYNYRDAGISLNKSSKSTDYAQRMMLSQRTVEETINYTVTTNDGLDGRNDFYLYMNENTVHVTAVEITRSASAIPDLDWSIYTMSRTTVTVPDLNADGKQDWIYVSATSSPRRVVNFDVNGENEVDLSRVTTAEGGGPDANTGVYKYKVSQPGNVNLIFDEGTKIYKIGVTHILKEIHPVGGTGWATEIRNHSIDHELTGYFTKNDVNAYTVKYDSYDMKTATVALTPVNEDGYVPEKTGIVMRLDNVGHLSDANSGKYVPLFYPSYTRGQTTTDVDFPDHNWMYNNPATTEINNQNYNEVFYNPVGNDINYSKFVLTNVHWKYTVTIDNGSVTDKQWEVQDNAAAAGFRRLHIWSTTDVTPNLSASEVASRNTMPANTAFLCVPTEQLPVALWGTFPSSSSRLYTLGIRELDNETTDLTAPRDDNKENGRQCWYTLNGTMLSATPTKPGIYIKNGRKVVVR